MLVKSLKLGVLACIAGLTMAGAAMADDAYVLRSDVLRAGPDYDFPAIERIRRGETVDVLGCTRYYDWCDIEFDGERGWFPGDNLAFDYEGDRRPLPMIAPLIGMMILDFTLDDYWRRHYYNRPWYGHRDRFHDWHPKPPPHRDPPPPPGDWHKKPHADGLPKNVPHREFKKHDAPLSPPSDNHDAPKLREAPRLKVDPQRGPSGQSDEQPKRKKFCPIGQKCD